MNHQQALMHLAEAALRNTSPHDPATLSAIAIALQDDCPEAAMAAKNAAACLRECDRQQLTLNRILEDAR